MESINPNKISYFQNENNYTNELHTLLEMGFEKEKSIEAIKIANGCVELAIDYLYNGFPKNNNNNNNDDNNSLDANLGSIDNDDDEEHGEDYEDIIYLLQKITGIIKILSKEKKKNYDEILQIIQKFNNSLYKFIKENEDEYKKFLEKPLTKEDYVTYDNFKDGKDNLGHYNLKYEIFDFDYENNNNIINEINDKNGSLGNDIDFLDNENEIINNKNTNNNNFTDKEKEIINNLKKLGNFTDEQVINSFFVCDKNEELAANYLFEHMENNINSINFINNNDN